MKNSSTFFRSSKLYLPMLTSLGLVVLFACYVFFYVSSQEGYYNEHAFRVLTQLGDKFQQKIRVIHTVLAASTSPRYTAKEGANKYIQDYLTEFEAVGEHSLKNPDGEPKHNGALNLLRRAGANRMSFQAEYREGAGPTARYVTAQVNLEPATRTLFERLGENFFDDLVITDSSGDVLYQHASDIRLTQLNALVKQADSAPQKSSTPQTPEADTKTGKDSKEDSGRRTRFAEASEVSNVIDVKLAGRAYKLYLLPLTTAVGALNAKPEQPAESKLILCGLRSATHVRTEALALPYTHLIWGSILLLAAVALIWPVLKISYMSPKERLRHKHVVTLVLSTFLATVLLTLTALNLSYKTNDEKTSRKVLRKLAYMMKQNIENELTAALGVLDTVSKSQYLLKVIDTHQWKDNFLTEFLTSGPESFKLAELKSIRDYPYFRYMFWLNEDGDQRFKIAVEQSTPGVNLGKETYFQDVVRNNLSVSHDLKYRFRLQPMTSPNTGEFLVALAIKFDNPAKTANPLKASVLVSQFESLVDPIVPAGYGYAVVNSAGKVQFHSNSSRNLIEDFAKESRPSTALLALLANASEDWTDTNYMGRRRTLFVTPLEGLGLTNLSLIVFRDIDYFTTLNVTVVLVFTLIIAFYAIPFVLAALVLLVKKEYPLEMIWPCMSQRGHYVNVLIVSLLLTVTFFASYHTFEARETLLLSMLVGFVGGLFPFLEKGGGWFQIFGRALGLTTLVALTHSNWILLTVSVAAFLLYAGMSRTIERFVKEAVPIGYLYALATVSILLVVVVAPCCGFFKLSYNSIQLLSLEREQLILAKKLADRQDRIRQYYKYKLLLPSDDIENWRLKCTLDRHDYACLNTLVIPPSVTQWGPRPSGWFEKFLAGTSSLFPTNQMGAELRELAWPGPANFRWVVGTDTSPGSAQYLALEKSPFPKNHVDGEVTSIYPAWEGLAPPGIAGLAATCLVMGVWIFSGIKKIFLVGLENAPKLDVDDPKSRIKYRLIMGHPKSGKSSHARKIPGIELIDLGKLATTGDWHLDRPIPKVVGLDRFEFDIDNPKTNAEKLHLLEELIYVEKCSVVILSTIDPMFYLASQNLQDVTADGDFTSGMQLLDRWANVLSLFHRLQVRDKTAAQFDRVVDDLKQKCNDPAFHKLAAGVEAECSGTAQLRNIGVTILKIHQQNAGQVSRARLLEEVLDRAEVHYRVLWSTCTVDERLVLFQLAQDGWANPNNDRALRHLQRRNLIHRSPGFRIINESFRRFILHAQYPQEIAEWEQEEKQSLWKALKLSLITAAVLIGCWLLYAQQEILNLSLGYLSAFAAAGGIIIKLLTDYRSRGATGAAAK